MAARISASASARAIATGGGAAFDGGGVAVIAARRRADRSWGRGLAVLALTAATMSGAVLAVDMLRGNNPFLAADDPVGPAVHVIGEDVPTSFGVVAVEHAVAISGLNDAQVTGAHAVPGLVKEGSIDIQVAAVITNLSDHVLAYKPTQFELIDGTGTVVPISRVAKLPGELQPFAAIDVLMDFVSTTEARPFKVRFTDPATSVPVLIDLGAVGCTVQGGTGRPLPVTGGCSELPAEGHTHG